jgi:hypothetical protein
MFKQVVLNSLILFLPCFLFSQNRMFYVETGVTSFVPFKNNETIINNYDYYFSNINYSYKSTPGFFAKVGIEIINNPNKNFWISVPMNISYKEFNKQVVSEGTAFGCFTSFDGKQITSSSNKSACISIGPKFNLKCKKITTSASLNFNSDIFFLYTENSYYKPKVGSEVKTQYKGDSKINDFMFSTSIQFSVTYQISKFWNVGLTNDIYLYNFNSLINGDKTNFFNIGYGRQSVYFCSGIRTSYEF